MNINSQTLIDMLGIYNYPYEKHVKKDYIETGEIYNSTLRFGKQFTFDGLYQKTKSTWFKDVFTLTTLNIYCDGVKVLSMRNKSLIAKDIVVKNDVSVPLRNEYIKDVYKNFKDIYQLMNIYNCEE